MALIGVYIKERNIIIMNENENMINPNSVSGEDNPISTEQDYLAAIKQLKENTVPKETFQKLYDENKKLLSAYVEGREIPELENQSEDSQTSIDQLRNELYGDECELSNLEYVKKTLQLRRMIIDNGGRDPFLPVGSHVQLSSEMIDKAEKTAQIFEECIEFADGDNGVFTAELQRRTNETPINLKRR